MSLRLAPAALVACVLVAPAATASSEAVIAATAYHNGRSGSDVVLLEEDGAIVANLTPGDTSEARDGYPSWSPDGSKLVFESHRDGLRSQELYVMDADGRGQRRLTTDSGDGGVFNSGAAWSPDGARIAFLKAAAGRYEIWLTNPDGSAQRRLTADGGFKSAPQWSPDGMLLLYGRVGGRAEVFVVGPDGRPRSLTPEGGADQAPAWSPDGRRIAFVGHGALHVMNADGSGRRALTRPHSENAPLWSPDGTRILFTSARAVAATRYSTTVVRNAYVVGVDAVGERRLTGTPDDDFTERFAGGADSWWPDGSRIFLRANGFSPRPSLWTMNADGSCERPWGPSDIVLATPKWRPGARPAPGSPRCADLGVVAETSRRLVGVNDPIAIEVTVWNDGNEPETAARLRGSIAFGALELDPESACRAGTQIDCALAPLAPQQSTKVTLTLRPLRATTGRVALAIEHARPDGNAVNDSTESFVFVVDCTHVGSEGPDDIRGTAGDDRICALPGPDAISALAGDDRIDAGSGTDDVDPGRGRDAVFAGDGSDVVRARDRQRDRVDCGGGADRVFADRVDVLRRCERVRRTGG